jgi:WD40 repeat protein
LIAPPIDSTTTTEPDKVRILQSESQSEQKRIFSLFTTLVVGVILAVAIALTARYIYTEYQKGLSRKALEYATQGEAAYQQHPLLGIQLTLEGLALAPASDTLTQRTIQGTLRSLVASGRLLHLGGDVEGFAPSPNGTYFILDRHNKPGEVRQFEDGMLTATLAGDVATVSFSTSGAFFAVFYENDQAAEVRAASSSQDVLTPLVENPQSVWFGPNEKFFTVDYHPAHPAVLYFVDQSRTVVPLSGQINNIFCQNICNESSTLFVLRYEDNSLELRSTALPEAIIPLSGKILNFDFSPKGTFFVVKYSNKPPELRSSRHPEKVVTHLPKDTHSIRFSPDEKVFVVEYQNGSPNELRSTLHPDTVIPLTANFPNIFFGSPGLLFAVKYRDGLPEIRSTAKPEHVLIQLSRNFRDMYFSPKETFAIIKYESGSPDELWFAARPETAIPLTGQLGYVNFGADESFFTLHYADGTAELRYTAKAEDPILLTKSVLSNGINISFSPAGRFFVAYSDTNAELRSTKQPEVVLDQFRLISSPTNIYFSPDDTFFIMDYNGTPVSEIHFTSQPYEMFPLNGSLSSITFSPYGTTFMANYESGNYELWRLLPNERHFATFSFDLAYPNFDLNWRRLVVVKSDHNAYLIDPTWLQEMSGDPTSVPIEKLTDLACQRTYGLGLIDLAELQSYLGNHEPKACK